MSVLKNHNSKRRLRHQQKNHLRQKSSIVKLAIGDLRVIEDDVKSYRTESRVLRLFSVDSEEDFNAYSLLSPSRSMRTPRGGASPFRATSHIRGFPSFGNTQSPKESKNRLNKILIKLKEKRALINAHKSKKIADAKTKSDKEKLLIEKLFMCQESCDFRKAEQFSNLNNNNNENKTNHKINDENDNIDDTKQENIELQKIHNKANLLKECMDYLNGNEWKVCTFILYKYI